MEHKYLVAQIVGVIAIVFSLSVFQTNNRRKMLYAGTIGAIFWTLQFYLLGAEAGAAMNAIGAVRNMTLAHIKPRRRNLWILAVIALMAATATFLTWQGPAGLLILAACILNGLVFWTGNTATIRRLYLTVPPLWFTYDFIVHSYPGMTIECLLIASNVLGQLRFDTKRGVKSFLQPVARGYK
jgi:hypothetical protein